MKRLSLLTLIVSCVLWSTEFGWAAKLEEPKVDYSADTVMELEGGRTMKSRTYHTPGKERMEMGDKDGMVTITRKDKNVTWQLMGNMYMEMPLKSEEQSIENMDVEQTVVGEETINGIKTMKYKAIATRKDGKKFGGFFWITKEGITVKMDLLFKEGDRKNRMFMELQNLQIAKQDPQLFEIPPGYEKNDMGAMFGGMEQGMSQGKAPNGKGRQTPPNMEELMKNMGKGKDGEPVDMEKMMKGMMGR